MTENCSMYLVFNRRAVSRALRFHPTTICRCFMQVVSNKLVCIFCCTCQVTTHLLPFYVELRIKAKPIYLCKTVVTRLKTTAMYLDKKGKRTIIYLLLLLNLWCLLLNTLISFKTVLKAWNWSNRCGDKHGVQSVLVYDARCMRMVSMGSGFGWGVDHIVMDHFRLNIKNMCHSATQI